MCVSKCDAILESRAAEEMADPFIAESACHAVLLGHSVEDGLHHRRGNRHACLANSVALLSRKGNEHIASISRFAKFVLVLVQPSSQCPRRQPRSEDMRQPCRQMVRDRLVVPSCKWRSSA